MYFYLGYGLAASQLQRVKDAGLTLTVCVDEVAASGGYLMASVADEITASPFALLGSIGVVATMPNFSERLKREGVVFEEVTAGQFKRTMTPYTKSSIDDRRKVQEDITSVYNAFKSFLRSQRPILNVDSVATGETWSGQEALKRNLVDRYSATLPYILLSSLNITILYRLSPLLALPSSRICPHPVYASPSM